MRLPQTQFFEIIRILRFVHPRCVWTVHLLNIYKPPIFQYCRLFLAFCPARVHIQVGLAHQSSMIARIAHISHMTGTALIGLNDILPDTVFPHIPPRHHRRPRRHTNRPIGITLTKHHPFRPQTIQMRCLNHRMSGAPHRITAMLIRIYENDIGF